MSKAKVERKLLPDIVDEIESPDTQMEIIQTLERAHQIKKILGSERDDKTGKPERGDPNYGLLAELADLKDQLLMMQVSNDLDGLRHLRQGCVADQREGRRYLSTEKLLDNGVSPEQIRDSTVQGESFYVVTLFEIKPT